MSDRPRPAVLSGLVDIAGAAGVVATFIAAMWHWNELPGQIPIHFDLSGRPDSFGGRWMIWTLPFVSTVLYVGLSGLASRIGGSSGRDRGGSPQNTSRALGESVSGAIRSGVVWLMTLLTWQSAQVALKRRDALDLREAAPLLLVVVIVIVALSASALRRPR